MKDLSMHVLDIIQNSVAAGAKNIEILIDEEISKDILTICIKDDGKGMSPSLLAQIRDPFITSRTTRKVGLGIPLFEQTCSISAGDILIESEVDVGTTVTATLKHSHIDRPPLGDIGGTMFIQIVTEPDIDYIYKHTINGKSFEIKTVEIKKILEGIPFSEPSVMEWIRSSIEEGLEMLGS